MHLIRLAHCLKPSKGRVFFKMPPRFSAFFLLLQLWNLSSCPGRVWCWSGGLILLWSSHPQPARTSCQHLTLYITGHFKICCQSALTWIKAQGCCAGYHFASVLRLSECGVSGVQIVRAETDSGFGSSYLNQTGLFQPNLLAGRYKNKEQSSIGCWLTGEYFSLDLICRVQPHSDALSNSDTEGSCSNVHTVPSVITTRQGWDGPNQSAVAVGVEQWVENTTKLSSLRLQGEQIL